MRLSGLSRCCCKGLDAGGFQGRQGESAQLTDSPTHLPQTMTSPAAAIEASAATSPCTTTLPGDSTCSSSLTDLLM